MRVMQLRDQLSQSTTSTSLLKAQLANLEESHAEELKKLQEEFVRENEGLKSQLAQEGETGTFFTIFQFLGF
jgi:hypothetical protein